ncbi:hypothetical protein NPIL_593131 [Nephila pilipes]|uniref:Uncharacterized protein n=1 Tax=Nephila pilipes TaxID=299642 RepID=A0A8X6T209_NEPPI|nr:hypothetical protein NPIL_593131 [Nephila pilipes]
MCVASVYASSYVKLAHEGPVIRGENCEICLMGGSVQKMNDDNSYTSAGVVGGVTLGVVLLIALILVSFYYRRRLKRLKYELAYETYAADQTF